MLSRQDERTSVTAIIQARMNSSRLPGKTIKKLCGKPVLSHIIERTFKMKYVTRVVVATGNEKDNKPILSLAEEMGAIPFSGSDDNVLERFYQASQLHKTDYILRITGDNPFTDVHYNSLAIEYAMNSKADLSSVTNIPLGTAVEVIKTTALEQAYKESSKPHHREHVTPYIKEHPKKFRINRKAVSIYNMIPDLRLTIDTHQDFTFAEKIYTELYNGEPFTLDSILNFLHQNKELLSINSGVEQRPMTHFEVPAHELHPTYIM